jgi:hypothetical protein
LRRPSTIRFTPHSQQETKESTDRGINTQSTAPGSRSQPSKALPEGRKAHARADGPNVTKGHRDAKSVAASLKPPTSQSANNASQLPIPRQQKTNSALFRALEQPYEGSPLATAASADLSSSLVQINASTRNSMEGLHAVSSNLSSLTGDVVGDIRWSGTHELSNAAEALFHNIEKSHSWENGAHNVIDGSVSDVDEDLSLSDGANYELDGSISQQETEGRSYDSGNPNRMSMHDKRKALHESWRASLEEDQFHQLQETYDPVELQRQQVIWEFYESEYAFVDTLRILVRLFIQPLRTQHQRQWIAGLAPEIMRLFDWLNDIANLHEQLLDALENMRKDQNPVTIRFSETIRPFIPLMELYQPYVVRVEEVSKRIVSMMLDAASDFGEFVRMQSSLPECEESLEEMLEKPLKRLQEYTEAFQVSFPNLGI